MSWTTLYIPLAKGLDLSKEQILGGDELQKAENLDWHLSGSVKGRPGREASALFRNRTDVLTWADPVAFSTLSYSANASGMLRIRDVSGERAALATQGKLFSHEVDHWTDRGPMACARVDRIVNFRGGITQPVVDQETGSVSQAAGDGAVAPDFGKTSLPSTLLLNASTFSEQDQKYSYSTEREVYPSLVTVAAPGNSAQSGSTTATIVALANGHLIFTYRTNGALTLTEVTVATDAAVPFNKGDAPSICSDFGVAAFYVTYINATNHVKVVKLSITGSTLATVTVSNVLTTVQGVWVSNGPLTAGVTRIALGITHSAGMLMKVLTDTASTVVDLSHDSASSFVNQGLEVAVGCQDNTTAWFIYRDQDAAGDIFHLGTINMGSASSITGIGSYLRGLAGPAGVNWSIAHQPILYSGRMFLTLTADSDINGFTGTWITLDITEIGFEQPAVLTARGPTNGTIPLIQPKSATLVPDGTGFLFPSVDWIRFGVKSDETLMGFDGVLGLNKVSLSRPRGVQAGNSTIFSGSIPHTIQGGRCAEVGFPFLAGTPGLELVTAAGGSIAVGSYSGTACWRWTDEVGQIHRSSPSRLLTLATTMGNQKISFRVTNPWLSEKIYGMTVSGLSLRSAIALEVYLTTVNPTSDTVHTLQGTFVPDFSKAYTVCTLTTDPVSTNEVLYTDGGVFANVHVAGDGGIAAVGRRTWLGGASAVYASKLTTLNEGPGWNDEGALQVNFPTGAGRIIALEGLDDKLVVFCERGIYAVQDGGPTNTGQGPDFQPPIRLSDLGIAGPRSSCLTDQGIVFSSRLDITDHERGGPWFLDRSLAFTQKKSLTGPAQDFFVRFANFVPELAFSPDRQAVYISYLNGTQAGILYFDMRNDKWSVWPGRPDIHGPLRSLECVHGVLWTLCNNPASYSLIPGQDAAGGDYSMTLWTSHLSSNGQNGAGWARVRGMRLQSRGADHTVWPIAVMDQTRLLSLSASPDNYGTLRLGGRVVGLVINTVLRMRASGVSSHGLRFLPDIIDSTPGYIVDVDPSYADSSVYHFNPAIHTTADFEAAFSLSTLMTVATSSTSPLAAWTDGADIQNSSLHGVLNFSMGVHNGFPITAPTIPTSRGQIDMTVAAATLVPGITTLLQLKSPGNLATSLVLFGNLVSGSPKLDETTPTNIIYSFNPAVHTTLDFENTLRTSSTLIDVLRPSVNPSSSWATVPITLQILPFLNQSETTWPSMRESPEWRFPTQKCASLQVRIEASPAVAEWAAIALEVQPLPKSSPPSQRA